jgi:hypothetical protein
LPGKTASRLTPSRNEIRSDVVRNLDIEFDLEDGVNEGTVADLIDELRDDDSQLEARVETEDGVELVDGLALVALISFAMTTVTGATLLAAFIYKVFHTGVTITCKGNKVKVEKNTNLPRGSVFIVHCNGKEEFEKAMSEIIKALIKKT